MVVEILSAVAFLFIFFDFPIIYFSPPSSCLKICTSYKSAGAAMGTSHVLRLLLISITSAYLAEGNPATCEKAVTVADADLSSLVAVPFPEARPAGYIWLEGEPEFDPHSDLALEFPTEKVMLSDLGYHPDVIASKATPFAVSSPFRVLSSQGASTLLSITRQLRNFSVSSQRIENMVRGGCYRSRWLRDLCTSKEIAAHMSAIYGIPVAPHPMVVQLGHLNFEPANLSAAVDKWHHDTLPLDFVMMVTDPAALAGGEFEWFHGTKDEAAAYAPLPPPAKRRVAPTFPGAGYAIALHGDMVVHRGAPLTQPGERITFVNGYVAMDTRVDEQSRSRDLIGLDDPEVLYTEWAKYAAWRSAGRLQHLIADLDFTSDVEQVARRLQAAIADVQRAADEMRAGKPPRQAHYEVVQ